VATLAGIEPRARLTDDDLGTTAGLELTRFAQRGAELFAVITNRQFRQGGVGEILDEKTSNTFECDRVVTVSFPAGQAYTYNARTGKYLGLCDCVIQTVPRLSPLILARLPYRVAGLDVTLPKAAKLGEKVGVQVELHFEPRAEARGRVDAALLPDHIIHVDVYQPDGVWCYWHSENVTARGGEAAFSFIPALNDPTGAWTISVRDSVTGITTQKTLRVTK
ncbi:MAG: hypothetical protein PHU85_15070, partial [Phycisphaerae bacterium]|nr:hypothetical protein [Phycisphaerae bacterium]